MSPKTIFKSISRFAAGFRPEPYQVVVMVLLVVVVGSFILRVRQGEGEGLDASVLYNDDNPANQEKQKKQAKKEFYQTGEYDANLKYAERVREASAISLGLSLFLLRERIMEQKTSASINDILARFDTHELKPPGVRVQSNSGADYGLVRSTRGVYLLRYRAKPFVLEVLACGTNGMSDGAIFLLRVPDQARAQIVGGDSTQVVASWAVLYVAPNNRAAWIPPAFSPAETFVNTGWQLEPLQANDVSPDRLAELNRYLSIDTPLHK